MRKTRRFNGEDGSSVNERGEKRYTAVPGKDPVEPTKPLPRERIISKKELEKSGFTNLTDFLNAEKGLKRKNAPKAAATEDNRGDVNEEFKRPLKGLDKAASTTKPKKEEKDAGSALAFGIPAALATAAAAAFGGKKLMDRAGASKATERKEPRLDEAEAAANKTATAKAEKTAKESIDTKAKRGMSKTGGGGGGRFSRDMQLGVDLDPKATMKRERKGDESNIEFKRGGKIRRFATGGEVAAKKTPEPPIPKATQESMKRQAAQAKIDRKQAEEQKAGEKEVRDNMGRIGFKKGGSASRRADGCAVRGKTRA
jgi:hypothetical protein